MSEFISKAALENCYCTGAEMAHAEANGKKIEVIADGCAVTAYELNGRMYIRRILTD